MTHVGLSLFFNTTKILTKYFFLKLNFCPARVLTLYLTKILPTTNPFITALLGEFMYYKNPTHLNYVYECLV